ncbi:MAG: outer membrane beta-barrel protein [Acidobacteriota bacterium]
MPRFFSLPRVAAHRLPALLVGALCLLSPAAGFALPGPAPADTEANTQAAVDHDRPERYGPWRAELFLISFSVTDGENGSDYESSVGVRAIREFSPLWSSEISYTRASGTGLDPLEYDLVDLSIRRVLAQRGRFELFGFAGAGWGRFEVDRRIQDESESSVTGHVGLGLDVSFGKRFYLRGEYRRRFAERIQLTTDGDIFGIPIQQQIDRELEGDFSLAFGWRLGS